MKILNFFRKKRKFIDDIFGALAYKTSKDESENFYYGEVKFQGEYIGIDITANENGPTKEQKKFFNKLNIEYIEINEKIILPFLKEEFEGNVEKAVIEKIDSEFKLDGMTIGIIKNDKIEWEITYLSILLKCYVLVGFLEMEPKYIKIIE